MFGVPGDDGVADLGEQRGILLEIVAGRVAALADLLAVEGQPRAALVEQAEVVGGVDDGAFLEMPSA